MENLFYIDSRDCSDLASGREGILDLADACAFGSLQKSDPVDGLESHLSGGLAVGLRLRRFALRLFHPADPGFQTTGAVTCRRIWTSAPSDAEPDGPRRTEREPSPFPPWSRHHALPAPLGISKLRRRDFDTLVPYILGFDIGGTQPGWISHT